MLREIWNNNFERHRWEWLINQCKNNIRALPCDRPSYYVRACSLFKASLLSETRKIFLTKSLFGSTLLWRGPVRAHFLCVQLPDALYLTRLTSQGNIRMGRQHHSYMWKRHFICSLVSKFQLRQRFRGDDRSLSLFHNTLCSERQQEIFQARSSLEKCENAGVQENY